MGSKRVIRFSSLVTCHLPALSAISTQPSANNNRSTAKSEQKEQRENFTTKARNLESTKKDVFS
jgi:hypothetical protein